MTFVAYAPGRAARDRRAPTRGIARGPFHPHRSRTRPPKASRGPTDSSRFVATPSMCTPSRALRLTPVLAPPRQEQHDRRFTFLHERRMQQRNASRSSSSPPRPVDDGGSATPWRNDNMVNVRNVDGKMVWDIGNYSDMIAEVVAGSGLKDGAEAETSQSPNLGLRGGGDGDDLSMSGHMSHASQDDDEGGIQVDGWPPLILPSFPIFSLRLSSPPTFPPHILPPPPLPSSPLSQPTPAPRITVDPSP